jgi:hypothetical protein
MKNIQVIDGAANCTYSLFAATDREFSELFPGEADVEFSEDVYRRLGKARWSGIMAAIWRRPVGKRVAQGIHGTLFFGMQERKRFYPTRRESEMVVVVPL